VYNAIKKASLNSKSFARGGSAFGRKPYADCKDRNKYKNGKSLLELAGVSLKGLDWVRFALQNSNS